LAVVVLSQLYFLNWAKTDFGFEGATMEKPLLTFDGFTSLLTGIVILVLLFVTILEVLRQVSFFKGPTSVVVALCVSLLSVISLCRFLLSEGKGGELAEKIAG